ncbi:transcriptional repressor LexA [Thioalkalicoccus limnaeus]|uniref:Transcriptional repressor LexA n=1 Tax=Thioalkalicoccus limnaeus TaxID=120681 RepID=A0ABV4BME5_9GAMM
MPQPSYLIPKRTRLTWDPILTPLDLEEETGVEIPLLGYVAAGRPVETPEDQETITVPRHMVRKNSYALRVRGHSMTEDQIQDGDIILVEQRQTAENGETVVALIHGERVTLKRFYVERDGVRLQPANPEMAPLYLRHDEIEILGIVSGVVRIPDAPDR